MIGAIRERPWAIRFSVFIVSYVLLGHLIYTFWIARVFMKGFWFQPFWISSLLVMAVLMILPPWGLERLSRSFLSSLLWGLTVGFISAFLGNLITSWMHPSNPEMVYNFFRSIGDLKSAAFVIFILPVLMLLVPFTTVISAITTLVQKKFGRTSHR